MSFNKLTWGVKASFRSYVEGMGGTISLGDDATRNEEGAFVFAALPGGDLAITADGRASGAMRFRGSVTFEAHGGMLNTTLNELGLEADADGLVLTVSEAPMNQGRCAVAKLSFVEAEADNAVVLGAEITLDGMYQIADNYPPGTELDPIRLD